MDVQVTLPSWPLDPVLALADEQGVSIWSVGGVVRDALLQRETHDWDFAVDGDAIRLARAVADSLDGAFFPLDVERDTARVILYPEPNQTLALDFAALRGPDLETDLQGRDFTLNAMAVDPDGSLIDLLGGWEDLQARLVRATSEKALDDDPLRMIRAIRLMAELNLRLEVKTAGWIAQRAASLVHVSAERVRDEWVRILAAPAAASHLHMLDELGLLVQVIPEAAPLRGQGQSPPHRFDVWWHTLLVVEAVAAVMQLGERQPREWAYLDAPDSVWGDISVALGGFSSRIADHLQVRLRGGRTRRALLVMACFCHDLGKPLTCTEENSGQFHFYQHEQVGAELTSKRMEQLRFSRSEMEWVKTIVQAHLRPAHLARVQGPVTRRAIYRFFRDTGEAGVDTVLLSLADHLATWGPNLEADRWARRLTVAAMLLEHYFERSDETISPAPLITGKDLTRLGVKQGPEMGRLLEAVREAQAAGEVQTKEEALALADRLSK